MDEPRWLDRRVLEVIHSDQILEHGGALGVRDEGLLEAALARPRHQWSYDPSCDLASLAAAYCFGAAKNHAFVDGNKRTALAAAYTFLAINGLELEAPEPEATNMVLGVADGSVTEASLAAWIRARVVPWVE